MPAPGGAADPSVHGATLVIYNSNGSGETVTISGGGNNYGALQSFSGDNTWTGRGNKPRWLVARLEEGKQLADFAVS